MSDPWLVQGTSEHCNGLNNSLTNGHQSPNVTENPEKQESNCSSSTLPNLEFEDNFEPKAAEPPNDNNNLQPLPDSENYLKSLENKLKKLKKDSKLVDALAQAKEASLRNLLNQSHNDSSHGLLSLDTSVGDPNSTVQEIYRHLQPVQAVTLGETVQIVRYDQLELSLREDEAALGISDTSEDSEEPVRQPFKRINH